MVYECNVATNNKIDEFRALIETHEPDVVCITETWY
jgi:hypothetical protein